jgi:large subunit ribosomal protein L31
MKPEIHPSYRPAKVRCACGSEFATRSTKEEIRVEICSACHPFFTGKQKIVDAAGKVDRFRRRYARKS